MTLITTRDLTRRRFLALTASAVALSACGAPKNSESGSENPVAATYFPPSYEDVFPAMSIMLESAAKEAGLDFKMFDSAKLLDADQLMPGLFQGQADLVFQASSYISSSYPIFGAFELPFITESVAQTQRALTVEGPLYEIINKEIGKKGLRLLGNMPTNYEWLWSIDKPIQKPDDLKGMRIRTGGDLQAQVVKALGGSPVSMSSAEVYQALERGTIDGIMAYVGTIISRDLQGILRYGTMGRFAETSIDPYVRKDWFDGLDSRTKEGLLVSGQTYLEEGTAAQLRVHNDEYLPQVSDAGVELIELDQKDAAVFRQATAGVYDWWKTRVGDPELADRAISLVQNA